MNSIFATWNQLSTTYFVLLTHSKLRFLIQYLLFVVNEELLCHCTYFNYN